MSKYTNVELNTSAIKVVWYNDFIENSMNMTLNIDGETWKVIKSRLKPGTIHGREHLLVMLDKDGEHTCKTKTIYVNNYHREEKNDIHV